MDQTKQHNVFWTGGLDSTARVIHLLLSTGEEIQPHYIIRSEESTGNEIDAMNKIRRAVTKKYPEQRPRLLPTRFINEAQIPRSEEIALEIQELKKKVKVHEQLHIMADYCMSSSIDHIDITYERDAHVVPGELRVAQFFQVNPAFKSFFNAHADLTKRDCYDMARAEDWEDLLNLTSFCRRPRKKDRPCGTCGPCCDAVKEGMGFRLPLIPRIKARILIPFRQFYRHNYLKHESSWFFLTVKRHLESRF